MPEKPPGVVEVVYENVPNPRGIAFLSHAYTAKEKPVRRSQLFTKQSFRTVSFVRDDRINTEQAESLEQVRDFVQAMMESQIATFGGGKFLACASSLGALILGSAAFRMKPALQGFIIDSPLINARQRWDAHFKPLMTEQGWSVHDSNPASLEAFESDMRALVGKIPVHFCAESGDPHQQAAILKALQEAHPELVEIETVNMKSEHHGALVRQMSQAVGGIVEKY